MTRKNRICLFLSSNRLRLRFLVFSQLARASTFRLLLILFLLLITVIALETSRCKNVACVSQLSASLLPVPRV